MNEEKAERILFLIQELLKEVRQTYLPLEFDDFDNLQQALKRCEEYDYKITFTKEN